MAIFKHAENSAAIIKLINFSDASGDGMHDFGNFLQENIGPVPEELDQKRGTDDSLVGAVGGEQDQAPPIGSVALMVPELADRMKCKVCFR